MSERTFCEFCHKAPSTHEIGTGDEPRIMVLVCDECLQELQLGHVLLDVYGWSWTKFEGEFIAECTEPGPEDE